MSEIRDRVKQRLRGLIACNYEPEMQIDQILAIPEIAIVDREAELPFFTKHESKEIERLTKGEVYGLCQVDVLKAGWVKEVRE